jgi:tetratricopeptide (TPR) repeat protein
MMTKSLNNWTVIFIAFLIGLILLIYSNTLHAPFNFDDEVIIKTETAATHFFRQIPSTSTSTGLKKRFEEVKNWFDNNYPVRYRHLFYSSLLLNYSEGKLNPFGYHLTNIFFHLVTSIVIFFITLITIERGLERDKKESFSIAAITTLLFSLNPVHSETVNYISARAVGMSSFFYLSALLSFILGSFRNRSTITRFLFYLLTLTAFTAAILSKETALTFPIALLLYDIFFMRKRGWMPIRKRFLLFYIPLIFLTVFAVLNIRMLPELIIGLWRTIDLDYGLKQIQIITYGLNLILFPVGLTFEYDFPDSFFFKSALRAWPLLFLLGFTLVSAKFFRNTFALIYFCVLWFLITLAPTNSVLPRLDLLSERNLYLPSFGIFFLLAATIYQFILASHNNWPIKKTGIYCLVIFFIFQIALLNQRNLLYRSNITLWEDTQNKSPGNLQSLHNLSHYYLSEKKYEKAFVALKALAKSNASPYYISYAHSNLGTLYMQQGNYPKAEAEFKMGIRIKPSLPTNYLNLGTVFASQGRNLEAKEAYEKTETLYSKYKWGYPIPADFFINKSRLMLTLGLYKEAEESAIKYLNRFGDHAFSNSISTSKIDIITDYTYIKLVSNSNSMDINPALLSGRIITGNRSGAKARVISYDSDSDSLYSGAIWVKYLAEDVITQEIQGIDVTHHGADYTTIPKLTITGGGGTGATARVVLNDVQTIIGVDVINSGSGYTSDPLITVIGGGGKGAQFKATLNTSKTFLEGERISTTDFSIFGYSASKNHSEKRSLEAGRGHFILAEIYNAMGKHEQALREYSQVGSEPKIKSESHNNRALIFIQQNLFDRAVKELDQAVKISPDLPATHFNIGNLLIQTNGNLIKARWHLEKALKFSSNKDRIEKIKQTLNTLL